MVTITLDHIRQLIQREAGVHYNEPHPQGEAPFVVVRRQSPVLLSAPHGARTYRNNAGERWHEEDDYTAGMVLLLSELCGTAAMATMWRIDDYDPNYYEACPYKEALGKLIQEAGIRYVIDLHGAALNSTTLDPNQTIDLGFRSEQDGERSMDEQYIRELEHCLQVTDNDCDPACFVIGRNRFAAKGRGTITTFAHHQFVPGTQERVQAIQIEMKPQVRIAHRFPTATLYKSCGHYDADPHCVVHTLQALANFVGHLKATV